MKARATSAGQDSLDQALASLVSELAGCDSRLPADLLDAAMSIAARHSLTLRRTLGQPANLTPVDCPALVIADDGRVDIVQNISPDGRWDLVGRQQTGHSKRPSFNSAGLYQVFTVIRSTDEDPTLGRSDFLPRQLIVQVLMQNRRHLGFALVCGPDGADGDVGRAAFHYGGLR